MDEHAHMSHLLGRVGPKANLGHGCTKYILRWVGAIAARANGGGPLSRTIVGWRKGRCIDALQRLCKAQVHGCQRSRRQAYHEHNTNQSLHMGCALDALK